MLVTRKTLTERQGTDIGYNLKQSNMTHEEFIKQVEAMSDSELAEKAQSVLSKLFSTTPRSDNSDIILSEIIRRFESLQVSLEQFRKEMSVPYQSK